MNLTYSGIDFHRLHPPRPTHCPVIGRNHRWACTGIDLSGGEIEYATFYCLDCEMRFGLNDPRIDGRSIRDHDKMGIAATNCPALAAAMRAYR